ncbi:MAG: tRNA (adenosine(37)-N6)-threonylcarbamoyltransferase complex dimerization subunit type 1 TsaB [Lachnospiraceae bacterium]|nr:tRNA (adenosine(37)-N6)-threonylcarbamoyltransferase complex dimerization subunit type 1 TsaB [Lachnospiraceae bacterium]
MKILAIDTSGLVASCAITEDGKCLAEYTLNYKMTHSQTIMPMIDEIVKMTEFDLKTLDYIACSEGPGSFTGLRIGAATAKGLAHGLNIDIIPVPTLSALAYNIFNTDKFICPIMDARRNQVYAGIFKWKNGILETVSPEYARSIDEIIEMASLSGLETIFLGDGVPVYKEKLMESNRFILAPANCNLQRASSVAALAEVLVQEGKAVKGSEFIPVYLRKPQAERELEEREAGEKK